MKVSTGTIKRRALASTHGLTARCIADLGKRVNSTVWPNISLQTQVTRKKSSTACGIMVSEQDFLMFRLTKTSTSSSKSLKSK
jgi:hypothetical protein